MSLLLSEDVLKYREYEVDAVVDIINQMILQGGDTNLEYQKGGLDVLKRIVNLPNKIATSPEEKLYARELVGKTRELLANKLADRYLFET